MNKLLVTAIDFGHDTRAHCYLNGKDHKVAEVLMNSLKCDKSFRLPRLHS